MNSLASSTSRYFSGSSSSNNNKGDDDKNVDNNDVGGGGGNTIQQGNAIDSGGGISSSSSSKKQNAITTSSSPSSVEDGMGDVVAEMCANISSSSDKGSSSYSFNNNEKDNYNKDYNNYDEDDQQHRHRDQNKKRKTNSINTNTMEELERIWNRQADSPAVEGDDSSILSSSNNDKENDNYKTSSTSSSGSNGIPSSSLKTINANADANDVVYKKRVRETTELVLQTFHKDLYEPAIRFAEENQSLQELNIELKNNLETKVREVERLRKSELRSKDIIKNLLKAVGTSNEETKDMSQSKLIEAKLRADLLHTRSECLEVTEEKLIANRSLELVTIDLSNLKKERTQLRNDKVRLERERRSAQSLVDNYAAADANSTNNNSSDVEYYKRKAIELETHLQGMTARLGEKNREIQELRRDRDRNLSQNRLAALKASTSTSMNGGGGKSGGRNNKKSRHSF
ncbi:hypothetical protein FRACYDRAFT_244105 [Fragilariopsis cylindrus CCMP1102]|uniref:Uncharacterized protein n=1 Tax=Fragilariopsis cylindrus CCMP1102 TaxID=635003 RepID=A0A1E7F3S4_9STRA|nr:hypothetical protein FRACYDRAFT_244105 [Fragilariopsis cylindrus CCMP1102]|eukprot:OEU12832.1 hypothetical protein FRACYDRAFT_244105 [Fragilariopsis cylindrus CCMP1102]